jgi:uncharacterized YkwD family protein
MFRKFMIVAASTALLTFGGAFTTNADASPVEKNVSYQVYYSINGEVGTFNKEEVSNTVQKALERIKGKFATNFDLEQFKQTVAEKEKVEKEVPAPKKEEKKEETNKQPAVEEKEVQQPKEETPVEVQKEVPAQQPQEQQQPQQENKQQETQQEQSSLSAFEVEVAELTNQERAEQGLAPLQIDEELSSVAREKSRDMQANNYFDHNSPVYGSPFDMMGSYGIDYRTAGENIAKGQRTPEEVVNAWMNSPGHRANILNGDFTHIGVGFVEQGNHWTQMFIGK